MKIYGKEYGMLLTVGASCAIAKICPGGDLANIDKVLSGEYADMVDGLITIAVEMNKGYNDMMKLAEGKDDCPALTRQLLSVLSPADIGIVGEEVTKKISEGMERRVIAQPLPNEVKG